MNKTSFTDSNCEYFKVNPTWDVEDSAWKAGKILQLINRNNLKPASIVEVGCGAGEIINQLHSRLTDKTIEFSGYEIAPDAIALCKDREKDRLHYYLAEFPTVKKKFDLMLMIDVFEHVDDYLGFIKECSEKATYKIYHIPLDISIYSVLINNFKYVRTPGGHIHYFTKYTALRTITDSGYNIVDHFYTCSVTDLYTKNISLFSRMLNLMRKFFFKISPDFTAKFFGGYSLLVLAK